MKTMWVVTTRKYERLKTTTRFADSTVDSLWTNKKDAEARAAELDRQPDGMYTGSYGDRSGRSAKVTKAQVDPERTSAATEFWTDAKRTENGFEVKT